MKNRRENSKLTRQMAPLAKAIAVDDAAKLHVLKAWFPPFRCRSAVAVSPFPLRKFRKNYVMCFGRGGAWLSE